jgi:hypothetical protein
MTEVFHNEINMLIAIGHLYFSSSSLAYLLRYLFPRNQLVLRSYVLHLMSEQISTEIAATVRLTKPHPFHKFMAHSAACIHHEAIGAPARTATADISLRLLADSIDLSITFSTSNGSIAAARSLPASVRIADHSGDGTVSD